MRMRADRERVPHRRPAAVSARSATRPDTPCGEPDTRALRSTATMGAPAASAARRSRPLQDASGSRSADPPGSDGRHGLSRTAGGRRRARCREAVRTTTSTSTASSVIATPTIVSISRAQGGGTGMGRLSVAHGVASGAVLGAGVPFAGGRHSPAHGTFDAAPPGRAGRGALRPRQRPAPRSKRPRAPRTDPRAGLAPAAAAPARPARRPRRPPRRAGLPRWRSWRGHFPATALASRAAARSLGTHVVSRGRISTACKAPYDNGPGQPGEPGGVPPSLDEAIGDQKLAVSGAMASVDIDLDEHFYDPDGVEGETLTYVASSSDTYAETTTGVSAVRESAHAAALACGSRSTMSAARPASSVATARLSARDVLPTPPFCDTRAIVNMRP